MMLFYNQDMSRPWIDRLREQIEDNGEVRIVVLESEPSERASKSIDILQSEGYMVRKDGNDYIISKKKEVNNG